MAIPPISLKITNKVVDSGNILGRPDPQAEIVNSIAEISHALAKLFRYSINKSNDLVSLEQEFDIILADYNLGEGKSGQQILEEMRYKQGVGTIYDLLFTRSRHQNTISNAFLLI